jgi:uncharacterized protein YdhG (YjbR/CyaY superfamily)
MADETVEIDRYLAGLPADQRAALGALRAQIISLVPEARACISYGVPAFRVGKGKGKVLVGFGGAKTHCALFLFSGTTVEAHAELLKGFDTSQGTVRFKASVGLPAEVVATLVAARLVEVEG